MTGRTNTRVWRHEAAAPPPVPPVPQVRDEALRHVLRVTRRALLMIAGAIGEVLGEHDRQKPS